MEVDMEAELQALRNIDEFLDGHQVRDMDIEDREVPPPPMQGAPPQPDGVPLPPQGHADQFDAPRAPPADHRQEPRAPPELFEAPIPPQDHADPLDAPRAPPAAHQGPRPRVIVERENGALPGNAQGARVLPDAIGVHAPRANPAVHQGARAGAQQGNGAIPGNARGAALPAVRGLIGAAEAGAPLMNNFAGAPNGGPVQEEAGPEDAIAAGQRHNNGRHHPYRGKRGGKHLQRKRRARNYADFLISLAKSAWNQSREDRDSDDDQAPLQGRQ